MKKFLILIAMLFTLNGCVSSAVNDAIDSADQKIRNKWNEEWRPALISEVKSTILDSKKIVLTEVKANLEKYQAQTTGKLEKIGVKVENFDENQDGRISGRETLALVREIKAKNDKAPNPLSWWEILLAVGGAYLPLTGAKEMAKSKISGTGNGEQPA